MTESDPLQIMLSHDRWATDQMLDACGKLAPDQFHRRFDMGPGSLHDTLTHVIAAMRAWGETLSGVEPRPRLDDDGQRRTPEQLRVCLDEAWNEFTAAARGKPFDEIVTRRLRDGRTVQLARGAVVAQIVTHGMHHRAQCLNMLRQLGVEPLPPSSVAEWVFAGGKQA
jgi:uncharacterized damage-inducible protein DinB